LVKKGKGGGVWGLEMGVVEKKGVGGGGGGGKGGGAGGGWGVPKQGWVGDNRKRRLWWEPVCGGGKKEV